MKKNNISTRKSINFKWGIVAHSIRFPKAIKEEQLMRKKALDILKFFGIDHLKDTTPLPTPSHPLQTHPSPI